MDRRQNRQWPAGRACTNIPNGSPRGAGQALMRPAQLKASRPTQPSNTPELPIERLLTVRDRMSALLPERTWRTMAPCSRSLHYVILRLSYACGRHRWENVCHQRTSRIFPSASILSSNRRVAHFQLLCLIVPIGEMGNRHVRAAHRASGRRSSFRYPGGPDRRTAPGGQDYTCPEDGPAGELFM